MKTPVIWFGGKSLIADKVWERLGADADRYVEPFVGGAAVLLARPGGARGDEIANDIEGHVVNFWRSVKQHPEQVADAADHPVTEADLFARHLRLVKEAEGLVTRLEADPEWCDPKLAGWWVWGLSAWIGGEWCTGNGPWVAPDEKQRGTGEGVNRKLPAIGHGRGVHRALRPRQGVSQTQARRDWLTAWMGELCDRLREVKVACGDWSRVLTPAVVDKPGTVAVFLDPPYSADRYEAGLYGADDTEVAPLVREWCVKNGDDPRFRIALCGYGDDHDELVDIGWERFQWKAHGGYGNTSDQRGRRNAERETIWFSPHCVNTTDRLF